MAREKGVNIEEQEEWKNRRNDFIKLISDENKGYKKFFAFDPKKTREESFPIYELAVKVSKEELNSKELFKVLYAKLSFKGVSYSIPNENLEVSLAEELLNNNKKVRTVVAREKIIDKSKDKKESLVFL